MKSIYLLIILLVFLFQKQVLANSMLEKRVYQETIDICINHSKIVDDSTENLWNSMNNEALFFNSAQENFLSMQKVVINRPDIVFSSFKASALALDFSISDLLVTYFNTDSFYKAIKDCFPSNKYKNYKQLQASFVKALFSNDVMGKIYGAGAVVGMFLAGGTVVNLIKKFSVKAYYFVMGSSLIIATPVIGLKLYSDILRANSFDDLFPKYSKAKRDNVSKEKLKNVIVSEMNEVYMAASDIRQAQSNIALQALLETEKKILEKLEKAETAEEAKILQKKLKGLQEAIELF